MAEVNPNVTTPLLKAVNLAKYYSVKGGLFSKRKR